MRQVIADAPLLAVAGCRSNGSTEAAPTSSNAATTTTTTPPTTTTSKSQFLQVWERELNATSPRAKCQGEAAFTPDCVIALEKHATAIDKLAKTVATGGGKYINAGLKALEVRDAARKWNEQCVTQPPDVRIQRGCLQTYYSATNGVDAILAEIYAADQGR